MQCLGFNNNDNLDNNDTPLVSAERFTSHSERV